MLQNSKTERLNLRSLQHLIFICLVAFATILGCEPTEESISSDAGLQLYYSNDTIAFDTIFSSVGSITRRFKIYNPNNEGIEIDNISLGKGNSSAYKITVNGTQGNSFQNEIIFGKDSLLVLVEVFIDPNDQDLPFLVKDSLIVEYNTNAENIKLVAWGQDAIFISNEAIACDVTWTKNRPYVIYDSAWVNQGCQLTIEAGSRIYMDKNAIFTIAGSILIQGTAEDKVEIADARLDDKYDEAPGQWGSLFFFPGSTGNLINHAILKNGTTGIILAINLNNSEGAKIEITNSSIQHMSESGIVSYAGEISAQNLEVFHCKNQLVAGFVGGIYSFDHCTFSNTPNRFTREGPSLGFTNYLEFSNGNLLNDLEIEINNSIIWGNEEEELLFDLVPGTNNKTVVTNNIIRSIQESWTFTGNLISQEDNYPGFYDIENFDYQIDSLSVARGAAKASTSTTDLLGTLRDSSPDIGAYERKDSIP